MFCAGHCAWGRVSCLRPGIVFSAGHHCLSKFELKANHQGTVKRNLFLLYLARMRVNGFFRHFIGAA